MVPRFLSRLQRSLRRARHLRMPAPPAPMMPAVKEGPLAVRAFLVGFPKGADLHVHLLGAVYAETFIRDAVEDGLCVDPVGLKFVPPPCASPLVPAARLSGNIGPADQDLYDKLIDSFSLRSFVPSAGWSGHDQFFATFDRFGLLNPPPRRRVGRRDCFPLRRAESAVSRTDGHTALPTRCRHRPSGRLAPKFWSRQHG